VGVAAGCALIGDHGPVALDEELFCLGEDPRELRVPTRGQRTEAADVLPGDDEQVSHSKGLPIDEDTEVFGFREGLRLALLTRAEGAARHSVQDQLLVALAPANREPLVF
jgi:hypothetical protein